MITGPGFRYDPDTGRLRAVVDVAAAFDVEVDLPAVEGVDPDALAAAITSADPAGDLAELLSRGSVLRAVLATGNGHTGPGRVALGAAVDYDVDLSDVDVDTDG